ncbi:MAG: zinc ribbon domain-containing protein [Candidatus Heimdallarchaeota archaeon]|nr:zinc ribbon domain-containing protein [Candidatus Heimdallarchaeota archaeon]
MSKNVFCSNCGDKVQDGMQFCDSCGAKVVEVIAEPQATPVSQTDTSGPTTVGAPPVATGTPPTKEEKNKLILFMVLSIIIPIVGIVLGIIKYNKKDQKSGMHYILCGLAGFTFGLSTGFIDYVGWLVGLLLVASVVYNGIRQINAGLISADF